jgi:predicted acylesterase/phospholipase RssA
MKFKDLEYLALEGGGGKGAVYKGAIEALEEICAADPELYSAGENNAFLDYKKKLDDKTKIKGIAGSSAGAITALALALGLNSKQINNLLIEFPFEEFLKQIDAGKYRMISSKPSIKNPISKGNPCNIYIGEDRATGNILGKGDGTKEYIFQKDKTLKITGSPLKWLTRFSLVALIIKIIITGLLESLKELLNIYKKTDGGIFANQKISPNDSIYKLFDSLAFLKKKNFSIVSITAVDNFIIWLLKAALSKNTPLLKLISVRSIANYLYDGGLFSGFMIREFFLNCLLLSLKDSTYCKDEWIQYISKLEDNNNLKNFNFSEVIKNIKIDFTKPNGKFRDIDSKIDLNKLCKITFKELYDINKLDLIFCSTNMTTSEPMYFSHYWTPDFPVLEAVGMSMTIPPALKPVYNEANVFYQDLEFTHFYNNKKDKVVIVDQKGYFFEENHLQLIIEVMKEIKEYKEKVAHSFTLNTSLSFSNYLPYLRELIDNTDGPKKEQYIYVYNSCFKGMFIDGGVTNNIPFNAFRLTDETLNNIDRTIALKVDNDYPIEVQNKLLDVYRRYNREVEQKLSGVSDIKVASAIVNQINIAYNRYFSVFFKTENNEKLNELCFEKTLKLLKEIDKKVADNCKPWEKRNSALSGLLDSLMYGFDKGQIRTLNDNNHIVPLYCYGVGTYDFDLNGLIQLVDYANKNSKEAIKDFFK